MTDETEFRRWRRKVRLTQAQAAEQLGLSKSQVENLDAGHDRSRGRPSLPSLAVRHLMTAIAEGKQLKPWPTSSGENSNAEPDLASNEDAAPR
jgi:transcriptional regulator with XRE-family HTH domain